MRSLFILFFTLLSWCAHAQVNYFHSIEVPGASNFTSKVGLDSKGNTLLAYVAANTLYVVKKNEAGITLKEKKFTGAYTLFLSDISLCANDDIVLLCRIIHPPPADQSDMLVIRLNSDLQVVFHKIYGFHTMDIPYSVCENNAGQLYIYGAGSISGGVISTRFLIKTDPAGKQLWAKSYGDHMVWGETTPTADNGLLTRSGRLIFKTDSAGTLQWAKEYAFLYGYTQKAVVLNDGYVFVWYRGPGSQNYPFRALPMKIDLQGNLVWLGDEFSMLQAFKVFRKDNGNFLAYGTTHSGTPLVPFISWAEFDASGKFVNQVLFNKTNGAAEWYGDDMILRNGRVVFSGSQRNDSIFVGHCGADLQMDCGEKDFNYLQKNSITPTITNTLPVTGNINIADQPLAFNVTDGGNPFFATCTNCQALRSSLPADTTVCFGKSVWLNPRSNTRNRRWSTGEIADSILVKSAGTYRVQHYGPCDTLTDSVRVMYMPKVIAKLAASPLQASPFDEISFQDLSAGNLSRRWIWRDTLIDTSASFGKILDKNGLQRIYLEVTTAQGCTGLDSVDIAISYFEIYVPNAFSPNANQLNEVFGPVGYGILDYELIIYNRWGQQVYKEKNGGWNGMIDGKAAPIDIYLYTLQYSNEEGYLKTMNGYVYLLR